MNSSIEKSRAKREAATAAWEMYRLHAQYDRDGSIAAAEASLKRLNQNTPSVSVPHGVKNTL